jgi:hypothetical protein
MDNRDRVGSRTALDLGRFCGERLLLQRSTWVHTPTTNPMRLGGSSRGYFTRVTLVMTVVWGTTATMNVTCKVSGNGTDYGWIQACTSATPHNCGPKTWQWVVADGTTFALDFEANYRYLICQADDPGTGNGTVTMHAITGR